MPVEKKWYESKVILANLIMGLAMMVAVFSPAAADFLKTYFSEMGMGWAFVNIILRLVKSNIQL
jgi:hypothetical protein